MSFPQRVGGLTLALGALTPSGSLLRGPFLREGYAATRWQWYHSKWKMQGSAPRRGLRSREHFPASLGLWITVSLARAWGGLVRTPSELDSLIAITGITRIVSFYPKIIPYRPSAIFTRWEHPGLERLSTGPALEWPGSDRARLLGCWASSYLPFTLSIPSRDLSGTAEGWLTPSVLCFVHVFKFQTLPACKSV